MQALHRPVYEARKRALVAAILPHLKPNDRVLDVGCGNGLLGQALMAAPNRPQGLTVEGLERAKRGGEPITVHAYDGVTIPFADNSYDVLIVADVVHHETDEMRLYNEVKRVAKRAIIVKDHIIQGPLGYQRICLLDWAANAPYGVPCLYRYNTPQQWTDLPKKLGMRVAHEARSMNVYPPIVNLLLGRHLHFFAVWEKNPA